MVGRGPELLRDKPVYLLLATLGSGLVAGVGEYTKNLDMRTVGLVMGVIAVCTFVLQRVVSWAVDRLIKWGEALPQQIRALEDRLDTDLKAMRGTAEGISGKVGQLTTAFKVYTAADGQWRRDMERRVLALEGQAFGNVRSRDVAHATESAAPFTVDIDLPEEP